MILIEGRFSKCEYVPGKEEIRFFDVSNKESQKEAMKALIVRALNQLEIAFGESGDVLRAAVPLNGRIEEILDVIGSYFRMI